MTQEEKSPIEQARALSRRASADPSQRCGAVAVTEAGERFPGVSVILKNAPGLSIAAEQAALISAKATSGSPIREIALWVPDAAGPLPSGESLQIWLELAPKATFLMQRGDGEPQSLDLERLLPDAFRDFRS